MKALPWKLAGLYAGLTLAATLILLPLLFALSIAVQGDTVSPRLVPDFSRLDPSAFVQVFQKEPLMARWILNSWVVSLTVTAGQLLVSLLAAYPLALFRFRGRTFFFFLFLASLMIPWESTILPNYLTIAKWGWKDSYQALIVPFLASGFGIFLLRQALLVVPHELEEAAVLEGCGHGRFLWSILVPLIKPALATLAIWAFLNTWNQYYWPLLVIDHSEWRTTQVGITAFRSSEIASFNLPMAATLIVLAPTLLVLFLGQRQLVEGLTAGAVKG
ncbi:MAG: carbohydrate ABC transporter permease [Spirochaetales bacterium]